MATLLAPEGLSLTQTACAESTTSRSALGSCAFAAAHNTGAISACICTAVRGTLCASVRRAWSAKSFSRIGGGGNVRGGGVAMASGGGASILEVKTGASILGVGMGASATGETLCGGREGFAAGVTSWKVRSSIGAALRCVNPRNCDSALIPARHSSFTDDARARRVAGERPQAFARSDHQYRLARRARGGRGLSRSCCHRSPPFRRVE